MPLSTARSLVLALIAGLVIPFVMTAAHAATGTVKAVAQDAAVKNPGGDRTLRLGSDVKVGDRIVTDPHGQVQILFDEGTRLVVGPGSTLVVEKYLLKSDNTLSAFLVNALGGTFRFLTGHGDKRAYRIDTPTGTIGVRGTVFDFAVNTIRGVSTTTVVRHSGHVLLCPRGTGQLRCVVLTRTCSTGELIKGRDAHIIESDQERLDRMHRFFPYVISQAPLLSAFRVPYATRCASPLVAPQPETTSDSGGRPTANSTNNNGGPP